MILTLVLVIFLKICYSYVDDRGDIMGQNHFLPSDDEMKQDSFDVNDNSINHSNSQEFQNLMENSQRKYDSYWDINSPVIRIILLILFLIAAVGATYYFIMWFR